MADKMGPIIREQIGHGNILCPDDYSGKTGSNGEFAWVGDNPADHGYGNTASRLAGNKRTLPSFGYMFDGDGLDVDDDAFAKLGRVGEAMVTDSGIVGPKGQAAILTYFGQFIDHDITLNTDTNPEDLPSFSVASIDETLHKNPRADVLEVIRNGRIASLRLDSVYGSNPEQEARFREGALMKIGETTAGRPNDLRRENRKAIIADERNDENLVVAQLHLAFLRFHNAVAEQLDVGLTDDERFAEAKRITILHYQWLVLNEYLPSLCDSDVLSDTIIQRADFYRDFSGGRQLMPLEFSVAAFRFGHSMVRPEYHFNDNFGPNGAISQAPLSELFRFTEKGGLGGQQTLPDVWVIDWANFIEPDDEERAARGVDTELAEGLDQLELGDTIPPLPPQVFNAMRHLPARNLRRAYVLAVPTAQQVLRAMGGKAIMDTLTQEELRGFAGGILAREGYLEQTPLWLYILLEAELRREGRELGKLGSFIICQTLVGLLTEDDDSILPADPECEPRWRPSDDPVNDRMVDSLAELLRTAGVLAR